MKHPYHLFLLLTALFSASCGGSRADLGDFADAVYTPGHASGFEILGSPERTSTLLRITNPWQGADGIEQLVFLSRNGELPPRGFTGQTVRTPVRRVVCMSSSHVAMLDAVGEVSRVVGVSGLDFLYNSYINQHKLCGEVREVGYDSNINFELIAALHPDAVMIYGVTDGNSLLTSKLSELGIPYIYIGDYVEESPLGKAEWLRVAGELTDRRQAADSLFASVCERYEHVRSTIAGHLSSSERRPRVMLNAPYRDTWFLPSPRSYMVRLILDAGGCPFTAGSAVEPDAADFTGFDRSGDTDTVTTAAQPVDFEQAYLYASSSDVWLNAGFYPDLDRLLQSIPRLADLRVIREGRVYNNNARLSHGGGSDFWESGVVNPDIVLTDIAAILHPELYPDAVLTYYRRLD